MVVECHQCLYYDVPQELMVQRCMKRAETSGRSDDNAETIKTRIKNYFDATIPVVNYYKQFGKVRHIDATGSIQEVYCQSKEAALPEVMFMLGPKASGKSTLSKRMAHRQNMQHIDFCDYLEKQGLQGQDDETVTCQFIKYLSTLHSQRVVVECFP